MAKLKNKVETKENFKPDLELLNHKYSDFYDKFVIYDAKEIVYPIYKTKIEYEISKEQEVHPIIIGILKIISYLQKTKDTQRYDILKDITLIDTDILDSILAEFNIKGYIKADSLNQISLTSKGNEILKKEKEKVKETTTSYIAIDGVLGKIIKASKESKDITLDNKSNKEAFEFKPNFSIRPRMQELDSEFIDQKTLRQFIIETLNGVDRTDDNKHENYQVDEILAIDTNKFFKKYFCLFYKNIYEEEKILVIDKEYNEDTNATQLFDRLLQEQKFSDEVNQEAKEYKENARKFQEQTSEQIEEKLSINLDEGAIIQMMEHKKYFKYVLKNAKSEIYIQSPWIKSNILEIYIEDVKEALKRGVNITIKYGMKPRNRFDKVIDDKSKQILGNLDKKRFNLIKTDDHSKIIICDNDFMIIGSFNWLSFGGEGDRGEISTINKNKEAIEGEKKKFISV